MIDRFIIGATISASAVSVYAVPFNLGQRLCILSNSAGAALFPKFAVLGHSDALYLARDAERALGAVMLPVISVGIFLIGPFLHVWIGPDFSSRATPAAGIILVGVWFESVSRVPLYALRGQSRPEVIAAIDCMQIVPFAAALYLLISSFGLQGVAAAYALRMAVNYLLLARAAGTFPAVRQVIPMSTTLLIVSLVVARTTDAFTLSWFIALILIAGTATAAAWFISPTSARQQASRIVFRLVGIVGTRNSTAPRSKPR